MDPNSCLEMILEAIAREDVPAFLEHDRNLTEWGRKGGFPPEDFNVMARQLSAYIADCRVYGADPRGYIDVRVFIRDDGGLELAIGDPSYDDNHLGYCGASSIRISATPRAPESEIARCRAVIVNCFDEACEIFAATCS